MRGVAIKVTSTAINPIGRSIIAIPFRFVDTF
jgi:hypothetical protein